MFSDGSMIAVCARELGCWAGRDRKRGYGKNLAKGVKVWSKRVAMTMMREGLWEVEFQDLAIDCMGREGAGDGSGC